MRSAPLAPRYLLADLASTLNPRGPAPPICTIPPNGNGWSSSAFGLRGRPSVPARDSDAWCAWLGDPLARLPAGAAPLPAAEPGLDCPRSRGPGRRHDGLLATRAICH